MDKDQFVCKVVALAVDGSSNRWLYDSEIFFVALEFLTIPDLKRSAIAAAREFIADRKRTCSKERDSHKRFDMERSVNNLANTSSLRSYSIRSQRLWPKECVLALSLSSWPSPLSIRSRRLTRGRLWSSSSRA